MIRVLLTDDHTILRDGIRALLSLQPDLEVVGEASNGQELLEMLVAIPADVVLMDINMPVMDGFATMERLRATPRRTRTGSVHAQPRKLHISDAGSRSYGVCTQKRRYH